MEQWRCTVETDFLLSVRSSKNSSLILQKYSSFYLPTWPGANINRGMAHCYDIPNVYYKRHAKFTKLVYGSIYRSVFIEEILENDKYDTVEKLLKLKPEQYVKFLEYIVDVIINRNKQLQDILQEENGHE